jgi:hypothetical protein
VTRLVSALQFVQAVVLPDESPAVVVTFICQQLHCVRDRKTNKIKLGSEVRGLPVMLSLCSSMSSALGHDCEALRPHPNPIDLPLSMARPRPPSDVPGRVWQLAQATIRNVFYRWTLRRTYDSEEFDWKLATFEMHQIAELTV